MEGAAVSKAKIIAFRFAIFALITWTVAGASGFAAKMRSAGVYDAAAGIWSNGPGRSGLSPDEVEVKILDFKIKAADARESAYDEAAHHLLELALGLMLLRSTGTRRSPSAQRTA